MLTYFTAGESHGKCLLTVVDGLPYGTPIDLDAVNRELQRRQGGYGRGARMKIEKDEVEILSGVRHGKTIGSPVAFGIPNRVQNIEELSDLTKLRPGHADLAGAAKYTTEDARNVSERASARETAARVAAGALANRFLAAFGVEVLGYAKAIGGVESALTLTDAGEIRRRRDASIFYMVDPQAEETIKAKVDEVRAQGDTLGGVFEVVALGVPPGLGTYARWSDKLGSRLAAALMSVQTVKGVELGLGFEAPRRRGSQMHDEIVKGEDGSIRRRTNNAGGVEGGMSNGEPIVVRAACKPISTLRNPLRTVDLRDKQEKTAQYERSDICVVPAASVVGQAVVSFEIAAAFLQKFGADTFEDVQDNLRRYRSRLREMKLAYGQG
jgi:chorismate synthase